MGTAIESPLRDGDRILVTATDTGDGTTTYSFWDYQRSTPMLILVGLFAASVLALGRWRGLGALIGLAASLAVLLMWALPALLDGNDPVAVALIAASTIAFIALYLAHGINIATSVALLSTFAALAITGLLAWIFVTTAQFTGLTDDATFYLRSLGQSDRRPGHLARRDRHRVARSARRRHRDPSVGRRPTPPSPSHRIMARAVPLGADDRPRPHLLHRQHPLSSPTPAPPSPCCCCSPKLAKA